MSKNQTLTPKQKELVAVAASIAAGCRPCTTHHFDAARKAGATDAEIRRSVDCALAIRQRSTQLMATLAEQLLNTTPQLDVPERPGGTVIDELVCASAALAVNWVAGVEDHLSIARALGASDRQIQSALGMARLVKKVAGQKAEAAAAARGAPPEPNADTAEGGDEDTAACTGGTQQARGTLNENAGELTCAGIWGGTEDRNVDIRAGSLIASLYASSCDGGRGGDIHYVGVCEGDLIARVALADVVGHGQAVSDVSQYLYNSLRDHICDPDTSTILSEVNQVAVRHGLEALTTATVVAYDADRRQFSISYAGHPPVLLKRAGDKSWSAVTTDNLDDNAGLPLAVDAATTYTQRVIDARPGDRLFMYTDGVMEAPNAAGTQFGLQQLHDLLDAHADAPLPQLKAIVLATLNHHTGQILTHDDVTIIAIEVGPKPSLED